MSAEPRSGSTTLLLAYAYLLAATAGDARERVQIVVPDWRRMRADYLDGPTGLWALVADDLADGTATVSPGGVVRFDNGSTISLTPRESTRSTQATTILVDDGDTLGLGGLETLRDRLAVTSGVDPAKPRLIVVAKRPKEGWIAEHWRSPALPDLAVTELAAAELPESLRAARPVAPPLSLVGYVNLVYPGWEWHRHTSFMADVLQQVADGEINRLLLAAPPRYQKSYLVSRFMPAYMLHRYPEEWIGLGCSTSSLALSLSKDARELYLKGGGALRDDSRDASAWRTNRGGGMFAKGVATGILGSGFNTGIIDDPFPQRIDALNERNQLSVADWFEADFKTRRQLGMGRPAALIVMHQRLAKGDLFDRLIEKEREARTVENWTVVSLQAIKRRREYVFPETCRVLDDDRAVGEALCEAFHTAKELKTLEEENGELFDAVYQQEPKDSKGGGIFQRGWWPAVGDVEAINKGLDVGLTLTEIINTEVAAGRLPKLEAQARAWDLAATMGGGDALASGRIAIETARLGRVPLVYFTWADERHVGPGEVQSTIIETAQEDGPGVEVILPKEPGGAGKIVINDIVTALHKLGIRTRVVPVTGGKVARALPHSGAARPQKSLSGEITGPGRVRILRGPWNDLFVERHHAFKGEPGGKNDLVDACSDAYSAVAVTAKRQGTGWRRGAQLPPRD